MAAPHFIYGRLLNAPRHVASTLAQAVSLAPPVRRDGYAGYFFAAVAPMARRASLSRPSQPPARRSARRSQLASSDAGFCVSTSFTTSRGYVFTDVALVCDQRGHLIPEHLGIVSATRTFFDVRLRWIGFFGDFETRDLPGFGPLMWIAAGDNHRLIAEADSAIDARFSGVPDHHQDADGSTIRP